VYAIKIFTLLNLLTYLLMHGTVRWQLAVYCISIVHTRWCVVAVLQSRGIQTPHWLQAWRKRRSYVPISPDLYRLQNDNTRTYT